MESSPVLSGGVQDWRPKSGHFDAMLRGVGGGAMNSTVWALILFGLAFASGLLFFHPYLWYPLSLSLFRRQPVMIDVTAPLPSATLVFCAYNEAKSMPEKIDNLRRIQAKLPALKFACYVDRSTDATLEILRTEQDFITVVAAEERTGKAVGMGVLARSAGTEVMIFTDANVLVEPEHVTRLLQYFSDPAIGAVAGHLIYTNSNDSEMATTSSAYWRMEEWVKRRESRSGSTMGADGSLFASRLALYPEVPSHLLDDFIVSMSVIFAGRRLVSAPEVHAYERTAVSSHDEFRRKRRIACRAYSSHRHLWPKVARLKPSDLYKYISHRLIRWYTGLLAASTLLFLSASIAIGFGFLQLLIFLLAFAAVMALALTTRIPVLSHLGAAAKLVVANTLGIFDSWAGRTYQTWQPPPSR